MTSRETDEAVADARGSLARVQRRDVTGMRQPRARGGVALGTRLTRVAMADAAIVVAAMVIGFIVPLGIFGALLVMLLLAVTTIGLLVYPKDKPVSYERLRETPLQALPAQTERWLDAQRPSLPAPAITLVDRIGARLDTLGAQLASLDEAEPAAGEVRKLVGEQLPEFIKGYQKVPAAMRTTPRNGKTPDSELVDGLKLIDSEIGEMSERLAQGDLDSLATRGRYLEIKYRGEE